VGENISSGDIVAINNSGVAVKALATVAGNKYRVLGVATNNANYSLSEKVMVRKYGDYANGLYSFSGANKDLYLSSTVSGQITETVPTASGTVRVKIGFSLSSTMIDVSRGEPVVNS